MLPPCSGVLCKDLFATDREVVRAVVASLDDYALFPTMPEEIAYCYPTELAKAHDIVGSWYCVALVVFFLDPFAGCSLYVRACVLKAETTGTLFLLRRIVRLLETGIIRLSLASVSNSIIPLSYPGWMHSGGWMPPGFRGPKQTNGRLSRSYPPTANLMPILELHNACFDGKYVRRSPRRGDGCPRAGTDLFRIPVLRL